MRVIHMINTVMQLKRMLVLLLCLIICTGCSTGTDFLPAAEVVEQPGKTAYMALTFDDGPSEKYTPQLLDGLKERDVHVTFFLVGNLAETNDALVWRIAAEGHQIGNHSYDHAKLSGMTEWEAKQDVYKCREILCQILGEGEYWVRPPYGCLSEGEKCVMEVPLINWSVDPEDWKVQDTDEILDVIYRDCFDGCIILLHDQYAPTVEAALEAIDHLSAQGVQFVTVEELFQIKGVIPEAGVVYRAVQAEPQEETAEENG